MTTRDPYETVEALRNLVADPEGLQRRVQGLVSDVQGETFTGTALDGGVTATVNGLGALQSIEISTVAKRATDNLTLGDAVTEAVAAAEHNARATLVSRVVGDAMHQRFGVLLDEARLRRFIPE
ncbi:YbaB/EbfC family nucleoid-associated protein [Micromonospora sp. NPDC047527]|uniref:YbaB/EbfC family nucleoid-associated protein n=1 Tax=Micromonospora sp. NPDC047527 TaxID=3155144 RepID=UPI0033E683FB